MKFLPLILIAFIFAGCEKNIDFKLNDTSTNVVVDAKIESGKPPIVILSNSFSYYSQINPQLLNDLFIHNAEVYISNGTMTHKLKEYNQSLTSGITTSFYSIDTTNLSTSFLGEYNTNYSLRILINGKEYTSETQIPSLSVKPDTMYFNPAPNNPDTTARVLFVKISDPRGLGNYLRYFTKKNSEPFFPGPKSVYTDEIIDGTTYTIKLDPGFDLNNPPQQGDNFFHKGDSIVLDFCNINKATYNFWNTWEFAYQSIGNPFAQPNKVLGNISNGALGAFCGYASWVKQIIVQ